jgi:hypothetical protein
MALLFSQLLAHGYAQKALQQFIAMLLVVAVAVVVQIQASVRAVVPAPAL